MHHLKDAPLPAGLPEGARCSPPASTSSAGTTRGRRRPSKPLTLALQAGGRIAAGAAAAAGAKTFDEYVSDPNRPVPYVGYVASAA